MVYIVQIYVQWLSTHSHYICSSLYELWSGSANLLLPAHFQNISGLYQAEKDALMGKYITALKDLFFCLMSSELQAVSMVSQDGIQCSVSCEGHTSLR